MLTYSFSDIGKQSLYEYLYNCIKQDIINGILKPDEKLPSKRSFATHLSVSTITIENAYAQLLAEGYLYSLPKRGYYVADIGAFSMKSTESQLSVKAHANPKKSHIISKESKHACPPLAGAIASRPSYFVDFISSQTNPDNFPFSIWARLMREVISDKSNELMTNPPCGGILELREAICRYLYDFRGISVIPEQVIIGAGTEYLYLLLIQLLGHDKTFAVEDPGYRKVARIYEKNNIKFTFLPMDKSGLSLKALEESDADIIHISPSHHFPTGITMPIARRRLLLSWASQSENRYIIEDDYDSEFRLSGKPIPTLKSIDTEGRVIYMNTFTKSLASTIRISYMILPEHLALQFYDTLGFYSSTVSNFEQLTLAHFINGGYFEKHLNRMRTHYRSLRDKLLNEMKNSPFASKIRITEEDAGLHFLLHCRSSLTDEQLIEKADKQGIRISCLSEYYRNPPKKAAHTLIINYSAINEADIPEVVKRLGRILE